MIESSAVNTQAKARTLYSSPTGMDMAELLRKAQPAHRPRKPTKPTALSTADKLDYASLEHAGKPHRGKTTDAEKEIVSNNLDKINNRLERDGLRTIRLDDADMVARYGLEDLAKEAGYLQRSKIDV
jgi:hypothetical protein